MTAALTNSSSDAVVLFDGVCNLCNGAVRFIIQRDRAGRFRFASLQSAEARRAIESVGENPDRLPDSIVLIENGRIFTRSTAALRIARQLRFPWPLLYGLIIVPRPLRDWVYDFVARNRYGWFGKRESCEIPDEQVRDRFL